VSTSTEVRGLDKACSHAGRPTDTQRVTWVYAISRNLGQTDLAGLRGIGGGQIRLVDAGPLTAVVESVDPEAFSAERLQDRLSDPVELEPIARHHHDVVVAVATLGPALPLRLATVYLTDDRVRSLLSQRRNEFCQTLSWLSHRTECGIKAWADPDVLRRDRFAPESSTRDPADQSGRAYLSRRRAELAARAEGQRLAARCGEEIHAALGRLAVAWHLHPLHDTRAAAGAGLQVLNGAYLIESACLADFAETARAIGAQEGALRVAVTGPWPAYSFVDGPNA
jgi:hypothetical protein